MDTGPPSGETNRRGRGVDAEGAVKTIPILFMKNYSIDSRIVWGIIEEDLGKLLEDVERRITEIDHTPGDRAIKGKDEGVTGGEGQ